MRKKLFLSLLILYASLSLNAQTIITSDRTVAENAPSVRLSIMGGGGCRLGKAASNTEAALADHAKHTRWGVSYGADASWFFSESLGAGLRYNNLHVGHKTEVTATYDDGSSRSGLLEDQINIWFLGPQCSFRLMNATKKNAWFMIPQTTLAWTGPAAINATPASGAYLKIRAQLEKDGVVLLGNAAADALYIPLAVDWERGKKYIYTLEFNGDSALSPISFDMTVSNWTDAAAQEIEF